MNIIIYLIIISVSLISRASSLIPSYEMGCISYTAYSLFSLEYDTNINLIPYPESGTMFVVCGDID